MQNSPEPAPRRIERAYPDRVLMRAKRNRWWPLIAPGRPWRGRVASE